ncbi:hypothetical protein AYI69_g2818 [Smittium culicis]|uniref:Uncharacterized protein n=1 Tax=Smittium culicis TaxID=133412 RepID=A0A1R1YLG1_9FUNG|nr:hypothetical protein AYI69_g2818 [Smittium culicis]
MGYGPHSENRNTTARLDEESAASLNSNSVEATFIDALTDTQEEEYQLKIPTDSDRISSIPFFQESNRGCQRLGYGILQQPLCNPKEYRETLTSPIPEEI